MALLALLPAAAWAKPLAPLHFKGMYDFTFSNVRIGRLGIETDHAPDHYNVTVDVATTGLLKMFVKHSSHTVAHGRGQDFLYPDIDYESRYRTKKKPRHVKMLRKDGAIVEHSVIPPDNPKRRPPATAEQKNQAADPVSFLLRLRESLHRTLEEKKDRFSLYVYDGRRLTKANFTLLGKGTITYKGKKLSVLRLEARRELAAGFTTEEIAKHNPKEPPLFLYVTDDDRLLPVRAEAALWMGTVAATLATECGAKESCLLGMALLH